MKAQAVIYFYAASLFGVASPLAAQGLKDLPPAVQAAHRANAMECTEMGNKLNIGAKYVWRTDFNGDGKPDYVLDQEALECVGALSTYGGSAGTMYDVFVSQPGGGYFHKGFRGSAASLVKRGKLMTLRMPGEGSAVTYWGWNGRQFAPVR